MEHGFVKIAAVIPQTTVGDCKANSASIISAAEKAVENGAELILFPELSISSSTCGDIFNQPFFISECEKAVAEIAASTANQNSILIVGAPVHFGNSIYNCAIVMHGGKITGITAKSLLNNNESRHFASGASIPQGCRTMYAGQETAIGTSPIFKTPSFTFGLEIGSESQAPITPGAYLAISGADIILCPSAIGETAGLNTIIRQGIKDQSKRLKCGYVFANSGWGESTSKASYSGYASIAECGHMIVEAERFQTASHMIIGEIDTEKIHKERISDTSFTKYSATTPYIYIEQKDNGSTELTRKISPMPFIPEKQEKDARFNEIFMIQATSLARRMEHTRSQTAVIGISGGLDSTLALLATVKAFDILGKPHSDIITVTMPGFGTTGRTYFNALNLMNSFGTTVKEISIKEACIQHFKDINHNIEIHDITYENSQARERTQILMDIANQLNGIVIGTGDMSELALGWATYNGDHMSMYGINASIPKTLIQHIVRWVAEKCDNEVIAKTLIDIVGTPISPELTPADDKGNIKQKTEDLVGPYELHDFFLYNFVNNGYSPAKIYFLAQKAFEGIYDNTTIKKWLKTFTWRFFTQQFKRSCMPDGPKTGCCSLDREGWDMPSDTSPAMFARICDAIDTEDNL